MENVNQFTRVGTFCDKCCQIICICKPHEVAHAAQTKENDKLDTIIDLLKKVSFRQENYTNEETMVFLKSSKRSLQKWRSEGLLPHVIIDSKLLYTHDNLMEFLENHTRNSKRNIPSLDEIAIASQRYTNDVGEQRSFGDGAKWLISKLGYISGH
jgi:hypothetical protein